MIGRRECLHRYQQLEGELIGNELPLPDMFPVHERDSRTGLTGTSGAPDAVKIRRRVLRNIIIDDVSHIRDIDATSCDVGSDQDLDLTGTEISEPFLTGDLGKIPVDRTGTETTFTHLVRQALSHTLGTTEHDRRTATFGL